MPDYSRNPRYWLERRAKRHPEGEPCPECPYWAGRDRWTGQLLK
jgi:hypothetical protein